MGKLTIAEAILLRAYRLEAEDAPIVFIVMALIVERGVLFAGFEKVSRYRTSAGIEVDFIEYANRELVVINRL